SVIFSAPAWYSDPVHSFRASAVTWGGRTDTDQDTKEKWLLSMLNSYGNAFDRRRQTETEIAYLQFAHDREKQFAEARFLQQAATNDEDQDDATMKDERTQHISDFSRSVCPALMEQDTNVVAIALDADFVATRDGAGLTVRELGDFHKMTLKEGDDVLKAAGKSNEAEVLSGESLSNVRTRYRLEETQVKACGLSKKTPFAAYVDVDLATPRVGNKEKCDLPTQRIRARYGLVVQSGSPVLRAQDGALGFVKRIITAKEAAVGLDILGKGVAHDFVSNAVQHIPKLRDILNTDEEKLKAELDFP
ncbi:unnamed protein product, partial [Amoebophrya sp. A25]